MSRWWKSAADDKSRFSGKLMEAIRPSEVCRALLTALEAAEGRRRSRKRDQTPDAIGLGIKRDILAAVVAADPDPENFESWLLEYPLRCAPELAGPVTAMARAVFDEWNLAHSLGDFKTWLDRGAPSEDAHTTKRPVAGDNVRPFR
jgi:hypothetical protein